MLRTSLIFVAATFVALTMLAKIDVVGAQSMRPGATPMCVYDGRSFSEGAHVCVQKSLMMKCIMNDEKPLWTLVLDKDLSNYCVTPLQREATGNQTPQRHIARHSRLATPVTGSTACFTFNGKRYCE
jgi:hypothetical protein